MQLPKGWSYYDPLAKNDNRPVECNCCDWKGREHDLDDCAWSYDGIYQRVERGGVLPAGTCPAEHIGMNRTCSALVYFSDVIVAFKEIPNVLDQIAEATQ